MVRRLTVPAASHPARMAGQASDINLSLETEMSGGVISRRHAPVLCRSVPGERRLMQETVDFNQVGGEYSSSPDSIADRQVNPRDFLPHRRPQDFFVAELTVLAINVIGMSGQLVLKGIVARLGLGVHLGKRPTVGGKQVRFVFLGMTFFAGVHTDVVRIGSGIEKATFAVGWQGNVWAERVADLFPVSVHGEDNRDCHTHA